MERMKATDFPQEVLNLFDSYVHGGISRREFIDGAGKFAVGGMTGAAIFEALAPNYAWSQQVPATDARIRVERVTFPSPQGFGTGGGILARPAQGTRFPAVVVVHENRGLNPYQEDVVRRLAAAGFLAIGPDALHSLGGYPKSEAYDAANDAKATEMQRSLDGRKITEDFVAAANFIRTHANSNGNVGVTGFCFGGGMSNTLAYRVPEIKAAAPYYGNQPPAAEVPKIKAELVIHYAETDERINAGWPAYETALKAAGVKYAAHFYPGTQHGFHNDTTPRFNEVQARISWQRTLDLFNRTLRS
jgi:carboxymethylenebutenolidase